jgi:hypothetical protein
VNLQQAKGSGKRRRSARTSSLADNCKKGIGNLVAKGLLESVREEEHFVKAAHPVRLRKKHSSDRSLHHSRALRNKDSSAT